MNESIPSPPSNLEYEQINDNIRFLAEVRFKLLALIPTLGGSAVFILAHAGLETGKDPVTSISGLLVVLIVSMFGFLATLGITLYDQRNSELYNALIHRAKYLETQLGFSKTPGALRELKRGGGQFNERPPKARSLIFKAGHDLGLSLVYGPLLGAWLFPISYSIARLAGMGHDCAQICSTLLVTVSAWGFVRSLLTLDEKDRNLYHTAAVRDGLSEDNP